MPRRDRNDLDVSAKLDLLQRYKELGSCSQRVAAQELNISRGCLRNLLRDGQTLLADGALEHGRKRKRQRYGKTKDVGDALWKWFNLAQSENLPINRTILCQRADEIAQELGYSNFKSSDGWIQRWKKRHNLCYTKRQREANAAGIQAAMHSCLKKAKFDPEIKEQEEVEDEPEFPIPFGMTADEFEQWVAMDSGTLLSIEVSGDKKKEQELMRRITAGYGGSKIIVQEENDDNVDEAGTSEEPTPSNAEMRHMLHRLRIGLVCRGYEDMECFDEFDLEVRELLCQQSMNQLELNSFLSKK